MGRRQRGEVRLYILEVFMGQKLLRKYAKDKDNILLPDIICLSTFYDTAKGVSQNHQD